MRLDGGAGTVRLAELALGEDAGYIGNEADAVISAWTVLGISVQSCARCVMTLRKPW